ncbi:uncharacterized protein [Watersipora subatra]|uniref:uncharacterized protein n=1 Tax=Watersipora subatra TaxID=2589382 RepID=UPI00355B1767
MDAITRFGGMVVSQSCDVSFMASTRVINVGVVENQQKLLMNEKETVVIDDKDFNAVFDGSKWTPHNEKLHGKVTGVIPLMAAAQPNKPTKVRPVMDYSKELNSYISNHPGCDVALCQDKLRNWRKLGDNACAMDLKKAYLQLHVHGDLHRFQAVNYKGKLYVMTQMGFELNVAPKIMSVILQQVLALDEIVAKGTDHYVDDIFVNEAVVSAKRVQHHLSSFGLVTKEPVPLSDARVLGLRVTTNGAEVRWSRDGPLPAVGTKVTKRELFFVCGKLIGHYPVAGWLRVSCSYMKRLANVVEWYSDILNDVVGMLHETLKYIEEHDPVGGVWTVPGCGHGTVWCDASSIAIGVCIEVGDVVVEDASWLKKEDDGAHINVAESDAVVKGLNLAMKWNLKRLTVVTDSKSVYAWVQSVITYSHRPKVHGLCEMIVRRRLGLIAQLIDECEVELTIKLVNSSCNEADVSTRVRQKWLVNTTKLANVAVVDNAASYADVRKTHDLHHFGIDRTLYIAEQRLGKCVSRKAVKNIVENCPACQRVDPTPMRWTKGNLEVEVVWERLATDICHYRNVPCLTIIDCGPSRFSIWVRLQNETADAVSLQLARVFRERGPPVEVLSDNGPCFRGNRFESLLQRWEVEHIYSCAYRASGNGIFERIHRTIKRMAARSGGSISDMVFYYNNSPNAEGMVPAKKLYAYVPRLHRLVGKGDGMPRQRDVTCNPFRVGDQVYVKPANVKCTSVWKLGTVTALVSNTAVEVDKLTRHVADLRHACRENSGGPEKGQRGVSAGYSSMCTGESSSPRGSVSLKHGEAAGGGILGRVTTDSTDQ